MKERKEERKTEKRQKKRQKDRKKDRKNERQKKRKTERKSFQSWIFYQISRRRVDGWRGIPHPTEDRGSQFEIEPGKRQEAQVKRQPSRKREAAVKEEENGGGRGMSCSHTCCTISLHRSSSLGITRTCSSRPGREQRSKILSIWELSFIELMATPNDLMT